MTLLSVGSISEDALNCLSLEVSIFSEPTSWQLFRLIVDAIRWCLTEKLAGNLIKHI